MGGFAGELIAWGPVTLEVLEAEEVEWFIISKILYESVRLLSNFRKCFKVKVQEGA
jgi:hypothetical protein